MTVCTFDAASHSYAIDGEPAFSVTQCLALAGLEDDYSRVPQHIRAKAALRGTYVHEACDLYDQGRLDRDDLDDTLRPYVDAYQACREREPFYPDGVMIDGIPTYEDRLWWKPILLAGQLDRRGRWDGKPCIVDIKTSRKLVWTMGVQLALYTILWLLREGVALGAPMTKAFGDVDRRVIQLRDDGTYHVERYEDRDDLVIACAAIHIARAKWARPDVRKKVLADALASNAEAFA